MTDYFPVFSLVEIPFVRLIGSAWTFHAVDFVLSFADFVGVLFVVSVSKTALEVVLEWSTLVCPSYFQVLIVCALDKKPGYQNIVI